MQARNKQEASESEMEGGKTQLKEKEKVRKRSYSLQTGFTDSVLHILTIFHFRFSFSLFLSLIQV